jgi:hypothetical protein
MFVEPGRAGVFKVDVATTTNGGHPPEFWAKRAAEKIISIAETADPAIREQALAFRNSVERVVLLYMNSAIDSDRTSLCHLVTQAGHEHLTNLIRRN